MRTVVLVILTYYLSSLFFLTFAETQDQYSDIDAIIHDLDNADSKSEANNDEQQEISEDDQSESYQVSELSQQEATQQKDVIFVLDNSGSMKKNDPHFLVSKAVTQFILQQDDNTHVGIIIFDSSAHLSLSLTAATTQNQENILSSLNTIDYQGQYTDSPAAIERAIYELKNSHRNDANKSIIFITDGIVDVGDSNRDIEKLKWLKRELNQELIENGIKVFGIAFTENSDFELIQILSQSTQGEYYRAFLAADLEGVFEKISDRINIVPKELPPAIVEEIVKEESPELITPAKQPVIVVSPPEQPADNKLIFVLLGFILILVIALLVKTKITQKVIDGKSSSDAVEAYLYDKDNNTANDRHYIGEKPTVIGRIKKDDQYFNYVVVNQSTIGRRHALIEYKNHDFWISDEGSINGTYINGVQIYNAVRLRHGDIIRVHKYDLKFMLQSMETEDETMLSDTLFSENMNQDDDDKEITTST